jgi:flagellar hook-length control protein FliK
MMEAIGQKSVIHVTDEAVTATEFGMESGENSENKIFDATLEQMLAELPLDEKLLEELLGEDGLSASLNSVLLTQNILDPESTDTDFGIVNNSNIPLEILDNDLWNEDISSMQTQVFKKTTPISAEMIEVLDPRFTVDVSNYDIFPETGIAETGLQSLLQESTTELTDPLLQNVLQQVKSLENGTGIPVDAVPLEADAEFSTSNLQTILQKKSNQSVLPKPEPEISKSELPPELQTNSKQTVQGKNTLVQDLNSILENQEESLQENLQTAFRQGSDVESLDAEELAADNLQKFKRGDVPLTLEKIKAAESLQVVEKFKINEALSATEKFLVTEDVSGGARVKAVEGLQTSEELQVPKEVLGGSRVKAVEGLQTSEKFQVVEEFQGRSREKAVEGLQTSEKFQVVEEFQGSAKTKLEAGFQATEKFKLAEELQSGPKTKTAENFQKAGVESTADASAKVSEQTSNQFRTLTVKDTQLSGSSKSSADTVSPAVLNSLAEVSGTSMVKGTATNTSAEPLRGADLPFNMEQVVSRVRILRGNGVEEMTLRLHPEDLGQITVKIRQSGADLLIDMRVDNPQAKLLVEAGFDALRSKFLDQEFSYQDLALNVDINERDSQFSGDRKNYEFEEEMNSAERGKNEEIAEVEERPRVINRNDSGLNLYV